MKKPNVSRREFITNGALASAAFTSRRLLAHNVTGTTVVSTPNGSLRGEEAVDVRVFRGVPFAQPPVGELRFREPKPAGGWTGIRDARQFAPAALQRGEPTLAKSEDCLYLNIWAPAEGGAHPVFVWIHGGGFTGGHSFAPIFDGSEFAKAGIVVVTVAYRLGVLGFLEMEELLGVDYAGSANNALRDLIAALRWVKANIEAFGGDPTRVTVGGESAGAKLTGILMGTSEAAPLFHQMISESGGAERIWPRDMSQTVARGFLDLWTKERSETSAGLRTDPGSGLIQVQEKFTATWPQHFPLRCEVDGRLLPREPIATIAEGGTRKKRLLIGTNRDESALFIGPHPGKDPNAADLGNVTEAAFDEVYKRYRDVYPAMNDEQRRIRALSAEEYWIPSLRVVDAHLKGGGSAWMYRLDFSPRSGRYAGEAYHSLDLGLVWNRPDQSFSNVHQEAELANKMHAAWVAFIHGRTPAADGLPSWPGYTVHDRPTMVFDTTCRVERKPQDAELRLWSKVL